MVGISWEMADKADGECQICFLSLTVATWWHYPR